jgi:hypothetical protein
MDEGERITLGLLLELMHSTDEDILETLLEREDRLWPPTAINLCITALLCWADALPEAVEHIMELTGGGYPTAPLEGIREEIRQLIKRRLDAFFAQHDLPIPDVFRDAFKDAHDKEEGDENDE